MTLLTVRGRKSGEPRTTPIWVTVQNGQRWVISPYGQVQWVRNLRAAGEATLTRGRHIERVTAVEPGPQEAAPLLKSTLAEMPSFLRAYFDVTPNSSREEFECEVLKHPIFLFREMVLDSSQ
jgi:deazaflavin-dependent oxidoreductase (nitroreductase family)